MPRTTRAAARAQEDIVTDYAITERAVETPLPPSPGKDREPLGELTPNSVDGQSGKFVEADPPAKKGKGGAKGKKGKGKKGSKKEKKTEEEPEPEVVEDERAATASPASERASEELVSAETEGMYRTMHDDQLC